jgi:hypothetical protein
MEATRKKKRDGGRRASNHQRRMEGCTEPPGVVIQYITILLTITTAVNGVARAGFARG